MLEAPSIANLISDFSMGRSNVTMSDSHLLFANDTITFCDSDYEQMVNILCVLTWFAVVSESKLRQELVLLVGDVNVQLLMSVLGCNIDSFPTAYLGLLLGARFKENAT